MEWGCIPLFPTIQGKEWDASPFKFKPVRFNPKGEDNMSIRFLRRMAILLPFVFFLQGCAVYFPDEDDYHHHHEYEHHEYDRGNWRHEHSSLQTPQFAERVDGSEMTGNKKGLNSE